MTKIGLDCPKSEVVHNREEAINAIEHVGLPAIIRPSFTLGGTGGGIAYNRDEYFDIVQGGIDASPVGEVLVEESVLGWKEYEMEVVRDRRDNCIIICSIENVDPMGIHTGDSVTVAPALTLTDKEYQIMRDASIACLREIGVDTGGSNVQFAVDPETGRMVVIEMNPRVSRSSALASKATGFPIAKVAARLAVGYTLDELLNDITGTTPASFEPTIDYVVTKMPRFAFEKFPGAEALLTTSMKSVGEAMSIGRTFQESLQKALRSMETGPDRPQRDRDQGRARQERRRRRAGAPDARPRAGDRPGVPLRPVGRGDRAGVQVRAVVPAPDRAARRRSRPRSAPRACRRTPRRCIDLKKKGFSDERLAELTGQTAADVAKKRRALGVRPVYKRIDTCAAEFASRTPYLYSCYEGDGLRPAECEAEPTDRRKVIILGGGPNRIGQGIEFDYCCVHAVYALREAGYETIMVNCNPETVSTDYDTSDRLYFEPLTAEDVIELVEVERSNGELLGLIVQFGGQTPLKLAKPLEAAGIPILGTSPDAIDLAEDRERFQQLIHKLKLRQPDNGTATLAGAGDRDRREDRLPGGHPPVLRAGRPRHADRLRPRRRCERYMRDAVKVSGANPVLIDSYLRDAIEVDVDALADKDQNVFVAGIMEHIEEAGIHSGDSACSLPPYSLPSKIIAEIERQTEAMAKALQVVGLMNVQYAVKDGEVYVLEVNPRASRTVPFVAKATGQPIAKFAARLMAGESLKSLRHQEGQGQARRGQGSGVPVRALPRRRRHPRPRDALDRRGHGAGFRFRPRLRQVAARRGQQGAGRRRGLRLGQGPRQGGDGEAGEAAGRARLQGRGDRRHRRVSCASHGIEAQRVNKVLEGRPHIVDLMKDGKVQLVFNTVDGAAALTDSFTLRRTALMHKIAYYTTVAGAKASVEGIAALSGGRAGRGAPAILLQERRSSLPSRKIGAMQPARMGRVGR